MARTACLQDLVAFHLDKMEPVVHGLMGRGIEGAAAGQLEQVAQGAVGLDIGREDALVAVGRTQHRGAGAVAKSTQVPRSSQSVMRERTSEPTTSTYLEAPVAMSELARFRP